MEPLALTLSSIVGVFFLHCLFPFKENVISMWRREDKEWDVTTVISAVELEVGGTIQMVGHGMEIALLAPSDIIVQRDPMDIYGKVIP